MPSLLRIPWISWGWSPAFLYCFLFFIHLGFFFWGGGGLCQLISFTNLGRFLLIISSGNFLFCFLSFSLWPHINQCRTAWYFPSGLWASDHFSKVLGFFNSAMPHGLLDHSSLTRDWTGPSQWKHRVLTTGPRRSSHFSSFIFSSFFRFNFRFVFSDSLLSPFCCEAHWNFSFQVQNFHLAVWVVIISLLNPKFVHALWTHHLCNPCTCL